MLQSKSLRFFNNVQSKRATTIFQKCRSRCATTIFFLKMPRLGVWQSFFCIRHCHKHDSTAFYQINIECKQIIVYNVLVAHICTMIRFLKYFISILLLNKRSKHKFWTLISRSQEARLMSRALCGAFYLNCGCLSLHTVVWSRKHLGHVMRWVNAWVNAYCLICFCNSL